MSVTCPRCGGKMMGFEKSLSATVGPFSVKKFLPEELQKYSSVEFRICESCGYMEIYWKK
ncbi:MAG: hypothetical protein J7J94_03905 [Thaumarchaeota archaeon]|nr:hypothetical protein [Nitrososphaerota archaeon]